jgi:hypothetical protein
MLFQIAGAGEAPVAGGHFLDESGFDAVAGLEIVEVLIEDDLEEVSAFVETDYAPGEESVAEGVLRGALFACLGFGSIGKATVAQGCLLSTFG